MVKLFKAKPGEEEEVDKSKFDDRGGYEEETGMRVRGNLTDRERFEATTLFTLFKGFWGLCVVSGDPGVGKDLFGNWLSWKIKHFFPSKQILRDERPRDLYGTDYKLFNEKVLKDDLLRMKRVAKERREKDVDNTMEAEADKWASSKGEVMLKNSVLYLTEFWRYCYNREPHSPMNKTMGAIHKMKRHLDCLIIGTAQQVKELDTRTCLPLVDWQVTCHRSSGNPTGHYFNVHPVLYDRQRNDLVFKTRHPYTLSFDAGEPLSEFGGRITLLKPDYIPENEEERVVLVVLKKIGVNTYEGLIEYLDEYGDMGKEEILATLKELKFRPRKLAVDYPCWYGLFNSKSAPSIPTTLKGAED